MSRVVWEQVIVPWVLQPTLARRHKWARPLRRPGARQLATVSCLLAAAEAMFPLVALASRAAALSPKLVGSSPGHYLRIEHAAAALSPKCVAWIIADNAKSRRELRCVAARMVAVREGVPLISAELGVQNNMTTGGGGGGGGEVASDDVDNNKRDDDDEMEEERRMRREREWVAVRGDKKLE
ncbi:hypothetical protein Pelo_4100 [Pelomyxa schiedti]|nr:hypothetical protein Pelo_4100 [Pelomyxa schiedti]